VDTFTERGGVAQPPPPPPPPPPLPLSTTDCSVSILFCTSTQSMYLYVPITPAHDSRNHWAFGGGGGVAVVQSCRRGEGRGASADQPRRCSVRHSPPPLRCTVLRCAGAWWMAPENSVSQLPRGCFDLGWGRIARTSRVVTRGVLYSAQVGEGRRYLYGCSEAAGDGLCMCPVGGLLSR